MKNILSYSLGTIFKGKEIKDWISYHTSNKTSKSKVARKLEKYSDIDDDDWYCLGKDEHGYIVMRYKPF